MQGIATKAERCGNLIIMPFASFSRFLQNRVHFPDRTFQRQLQQAPVQIDGEAVMLAPSTIKIKQLNQV